MKVIIKILGFIFLFIFLCFIEMLVFLLIFGEGGQADSILNNGLAMLTMYAFPLLIVGSIAFKILKKGIN